jgi:DNA-binding MarR family transcriptional regulator/GNAT superfamily N-acetyltransferase
MDNPDVAAEAAAFRHFNRFYTKRIGVLEEKLLDSPFTLTEARVLFELGTRVESGKPVYASDLRSELGLDAGYLSRLLARFEKRGLSSSEAAVGDARRRSLVLKPLGRELFQQLDDRSSASAARALSGLGEADRRALIEAFKSVERVLNQAAPEPPPFILREPGPGDLGWVIAAHGEIYSREYGWGPEFEALVARIVADYAASRDPARERAWIAWAEGRRCGSVFLMKVDEATARLRLLILAPEARGFGLGRRLVDECLTFASSVGYKKIVLWTNDSLVAARTIYAKVGFRLVASEPETTFGAGTKSETWELEL